MDISRVRCFVSDMDGTFYRGNVLLDGALRFAEVLERRGARLQFLTNNSSRSSAEYAAKLNRLGYAADESQVFTSGQATVELLGQEWPGCRVDVFGTPSLKQEFEAGGFLLEETAPEVVILGFDKTLDYPKMVRLCDHVTRGVPYWATHPDFTCPTEDGYIPDTGSFMALVEAATGRRADRVVGKPNPDILSGLALRLGLNPSDMAVIGDRLYTDIATGRRAGVPTILVLTGETRREDLETSEEQPDLVVADLGDLADRIEDL